MDERVKPPVDKKTPAQRRIIDEFLPMWKHSYGDLSLATMLNSKKITKDKKSA